MAEEAGDPEVLETRGIWEKLAAEGEDGEESAYYYNKETDTSTWDVPRGWNWFLRESDGKWEHRESHQTLGADKNPLWVKLFDDSEQDYYYTNEDTGESQWEVPDGFVSDEELRELTLRGARGVESKARAVEIPIGDGTSSEDDEEEDTGGVAVKASTVKSARSSLATTGTRGGSVAGGTSAAKVVAKAAAKVLEEEEGGEEKDSSGDGSTPPIPPPPPPSSSSTTPLPPPPTHVPVTSSVTPLGKVLGSGGSAGGGGGGGGGGEEGGEERYVPLSSASVGAIRTRYIGQVITPSLLRSLSGMFRMSSPSEVQIIAQAFRLVRLQPGELLLQRGEALRTACVVVAKGGIVVRNGGSGRGSGEKKVGAGGVVCAEALLVPSLRSPISVTASNDATFTDVLLLAYADIQRVLGSERCVRRLCHALSNDHTALRSLLKPVPFLRSAEEEDISDLINTSSLVVRAAGDEMITEGTPVDAFCVVLAGDVVVRRHGATVASGGSGFFFGEMSLLSDDAPASASVRATSACCLLCVVRDDFQQLITRRPKLRAKMEDVAADRLVAQIRAVHETGLGVLGDDQLRSLATRASVRSVPAGESLVRGGGFDEGAFLVLEGTVAERFEPSVRTLTATSSFVTTPTTPSTPPPPHAATPPPPPPSSSSSPPPTSPVPSSPDPPKQALVAVPPGPSLRWWHEQGKAAHGTKWVSRSAGYLAGADALLGTGWTERLCSVRAESAGATLLCLSKADLEAVCSSDTTAEEDCEGPSGGDETPTSPKSASKPPLRRRRNNEQSSAATSQAAVELAIAGEAASPTTLARVPKAAAAMLGVATGVKDARECVDVLVAAEEWRRGMLQRAPDGTPVVAPSHFVSQALELVESLSSLSSGDGPFFAAVQTASSIAESARTGGVLRPTLFDIPIQCVEQRLASAAKEVCQGAAFNSLLRSLHPDFAEDEETMERRTARSSRASSDDSGSLSERLDVEKQNRFGTWQGRQVAVHFGDREVVVLDKDSVSHTYAIRSVAGLTLDSPDGESRHATLALRSASSATLTDGSSERELALRFQDSAARDAFCRLLSAASPGLRIWDKAERWDPDGAVVFAVRLSTPTGLTARALALDPTIRCLIRAKDAKTVLDILPQLRDPSSSFGAAVFSGRGGSAQPTTLHASGGEVLVLPLDFPHVFVTPGSSSKSIRVVSADPNYSAASAATPPTSFDAVFSSPAPCSRFLGYTRALASGLGLHRARTLGPFHAGLSATQLSINCVTFNTGDAKPPSDLTPLASIVKPHAADLIAIGFQECPKRPLWERALASILDPHHAQAASWAGTNTPTSYEKVGAVTLWEMHVLVFARSTVAPRISMVSTSSVATGMGGVIGNKGGAAVGLTVDGTCSIAFVTSHLAARHKRIRLRARNFADICRGLRLRVPGSGDASVPLQITHSFDHVFWFGDLNYRIGFGSEGTEEEFNKVQTYIKEQRFEELADADQLRAEMKAGRVFAGFSEAPLTFAPTYRMLKGKAREYSNKRHQNASYCDRVLWRSGAAHRGAVQCLWYEGGFDLAVSDHRPVGAGFTLTLPPPPLYIGRGPRISAGQGDQSVWIASAQFADWVPDQSDMALISTGLLTPTVLSSAARHRAKTTEGHPIAFAPGDSFFLVVNGRPTSETVSSAPAPQSPKAASTGRWARWGADALAPAPLLDAEPGWLARQHITLSVVSRSGRLVGHAHVPLLDAASWQHAANVALQGEPPSLDVILEDPVLLRQFAAFAKKEASGENVEFWLAALEFRKLVDTLRHSETITTPIDPAGAVQLLRAPEVDSSEVLRLVEERRGRGRTTFSSFGPPPSSGRRVSITSRTSSDYLGRMQASSGVTKPHTLPSTSSTHSPSHPALQTILNAAAAVWKEFIDPVGSPQMVNLPDPVVRNVRTRIAVIANTTTSSSSEEVTWESLEHTFDDAAWEVFHLMQRDTYERYAAAFREVATSTRSSRRKHTREQHGAPFAAQLVRDGIPAGILWGCFRVDRDGVDAQEDPDEVLRGFLQRKRLQSKGGGAAASSIAALLSADESGGDGGAAGFGEGGDEDIAFDEAADDMDLGFEDDEDLTAALLAEGSGSSSSSAARAARARALSTDKRAAAGSGGGGGGGGGGGEGDASGGGRVAWADRARGTLPTLSTLATQLTEPETTPETLLQAAAALRWAEKELNAMAALVHEEDDEGDDDDDE